MISTKPHFTEINLLKDSKSSPRYKFPLYPQPNKPNSHSSPHNLLSYSCKAKKTYSANSIQKGTSIFPNLFYLNKVL